MHIIVDFFCLFSLPFFLYSRLFVVVVRPVQLFVSWWTAAHQASLPFTISQSFLNSCPLSQWYHPTISSLSPPYSPALNFPGKIWHDPNVITQTGFVTRRMLELKILGKTHFLDLGVLAWKVRNFLSFCCQCLFLDEILSPCYILRTLCNSLCFHIPSHGFILISIYFFWLPDSSAQGTWICLIIFAGNLSDLVE